MYDLSLKIDKTDSKGSRYKALSPQISYLDQRFGPLSP